MNQQQRNALENTTTWLNGKAIIPKLPNDKMSNEIKCTFCFRKKDIRGGLCFACATLQEEWGKIVNNTDDMDILQIEQYIKQLMERNYETRPRNVKRT